MARLPVHRWYHYKEGFSPRLPALMVGQLGTATTGVVADVFAGVGTTQLALRTDPRVSRVIGLEYSPFAHFVAEAKLNADRLDPARLRSLVTEAARYTDSCAPGIPALASFRNEAIFAPAILEDLLRAGARLEELELTAPEKAFLRLGFVATAEQLSGTVKDGRALRIEGYGHRKRAPLTPRHQSPATGRPVADALMSRWTAMIEDVEAVQALRAANAGAVFSFRGDARRLDAPDLEGVFRPGSVGLFLGSPPYLNCIDYTEVYKLELWLLGFVSTHDEFRDLRLGTIRSHPSIEFPDRPWPRPLAGTAVEQTVDEVAAFVEANHARRPVGRIVRQYFIDMATVLEQQLQALEAGGHTALVVGNSTFSRRDQIAERREERWRIPVLSDVLIARIGEALGFEEPEIWTARDLRARNVQSGSARESVVILRKPRGSYPGRRGELQARISSYESVSR